MINQQHPITPPPELVQQWAKGARLPDRLATEAQWQQRFALQAAQWGADQELEACCELLTDEWGNGHGDRLHRLRRPKPPSLKEQALSLLDQAIAYGDCLKTSDALPAIRRALEALPDD
jgi:hypothetical protein